jgi:hypothetical protein
VARRLERATGSQVRIQDLVYNLFTSTFKATGIEAGRTSNPFLKVGRVVLRSPLLRGGGARGREISLVEVRDVQVTLPAAWIRRPYRRPSRRRFWVRRGEVSNASVVIELSSGPLKLERAHLVVRDLTVPTAAAGKPPAFRGQLQLKVKRAEAGAMASNIIARGSLQRTRLAVKRFTARLPDGSLSLQGSVDFGGRRGVGPFSLEGKIRLEVAGRKGPVKLQGPVRLTGPRLAKLVLKGQLRASGGKLPARGGIDGAPPLGLRIKIPGQGVLRGTLAQWRLRRR